MILKWKPFFEPYYIHLFRRGEIGTDLRLLKKDALILSGLKTDSQRYFIHHHSELDTFETINKRELELGAATMAALIFLTHAQVQIWDSSVSLWMHNSNHVSPNDGVSLVNLAVALKDAKQPQEAVPVVKRLADGSVHRCGARGSEGAGSLHER